MRNNHFPHLLLGRKLRHDRQQRITESVEDQPSFDELFKLVFHHERLVAQHAMRAVMVIVKSHPEFLQGHAAQLLSVLRSPDYKEIKGYVIQLIPKLEIGLVDLDRVWHMLMYMALNSNEQKTLRAQALQSLFELSDKQARFLDELQDVLNALLHEQTPSIQSKVLKLRGLLEKTKVSV